MTPSAELYTVATEAARASRALDHADPGADHRGQRCAGVCGRCRLEAKARLYGRAGDSAAELEGR